MASRVTLAEKLTLWTLALLVVSLATHGIDLSHPGLLDSTGRLKASDYARLYVTGAIADEQRWDELFDPGAHQREAKTRIDPNLEMSGLHPNYGPTAAWLLAPLSRLPFLTSWAVFSIGSIALFLFAVWLLVGDTTALGSHRWLVLLACLASPALFSTLRYGQLSAVTTAIFIGAAVCDRRGWPLAAGACLGMAFYKPNLVLPAALVWGITRHWRLLSGVILGATAHVALGVVVAGPAATRQWFETLLSLARDPNLVQGFPWEVHSLRGFWRLAGAYPPLLSWLAATTTAVAVFAAVWVWTRTRRTDERWAALVLMTALVSPHLLTYDLLLLTLPLVLTTELSLVGGVGRSGWTVLAVTLYFAPLVSPLFAKTAGIQLSTLTMCALLGLLSLAVTDTAGRSSSSIKPIMNS
jgi:alpha-1,2-mannosyltransferase